MTLKNHLLLPCLLLLSFFILPLSKQAEEVNPVILKIQISGDIINPILAKYIANSVHEAEKANAVCLIIELDTPGGLLESTREIVKTLLNSPVPVVVYVSPQGSRATSAGMFITCAAHLAAMAPSTHIGAAHPVNLGMPSSPAPKEEKPVQPAPNGKEDKKLSSPPPPPEGEGGDIMSEKILQDTLAWTTSIANARHRNVEWMKEAVTKSVSITEEEALKQKVIDLVATDLPDLISKIDGKTVECGNRQVKLSTKNAQVLLFEMTPSEKFLNILANPNIAYIFMTLGMIGLIFEFTHPGVLFPGIAGLICLLLSFYSMNTLPVSYTGLILIVFSLILFVAELFAPTYGALAIGGILSFVFGSMMLLQSGSPLLQISLALIFGSTLLFGGIMLLLIYKVLKVQTAKSPAGKEGLLGLKAKVVSDLTPEGKVFLKGEIWNAITEGGESIAKDEEVRIVKIDGLLLTVKKT